MLLASIRKKGKSLNIYVPWFSCLQNQAKMTVYSVCYCEILDELVDSVTPNTGKHITLQPFRAWISSEVHFVSEVSKTQDGDMGTSSLYVK
jgi:hypothetical protein